ncbi:MAG: ABC transporter ATP-binding protein [Conexivisphaera sp.]
MGAQPVLRVSNLRVRYGQKVAVDGISFQIMPGEIYGLLGPNGAGKSSTIKAIVNLVEYEGEVDLLGMGRPRGKLLNEVGAVLETPAVLESLTVKEFLELVASIRGVGGDRIDALVQAFGLNEYLGAYIATLSQGNRQKVAIASALMHRPKLLILDEPFNALDVKSARILKEVIQNHRRDGGAVLFSTHVMEIAERICDRIGILNEGKLIMEGTTKSILEQARAGSLEEAFLRAIHAEEEIRELAEAL